MLSMTLALFLVGIFGVALSIAQNVVSYIKQHLEVQVFLDKKTIPQQVFHIQKTIEGMDFVARRNGKPGVVHVPKEETAERFVHETGESFARYIGENPFRDALVVQIGAAYHTPEHFEIIAQKLERMEGVFEVVYVERVVEKISKNFAQIGSGVIGIAVLLFLAAFLIINNALRLAMFSQRFLIRSMQLVGANARFIKAPFLRRSILYGCLSAGVACGALHALIVLGHEYLPDLRAIHPFEHVRWVYLFVFVMGLITSFFSVFFAINRYLRMSLDQLY